MEREHTGYAHDNMHPRFIAVLLQIADALDIDNGRFHSLIHSFYGKMNDVSELHFDKHQAVRVLNINEESISISADCKSQSVVRLIRKECSGLEGILKEANYHWSEIAPDGFKGCLPTLRRPKLLYNGKEIPHELINAKFTLSQEKAFRLIEGANLYNDGFPYLREVLQNAIDATKFQVWDDYCGTRLKAENLFKDDEDGSSFALNTRLKKLLPKYPIEVELEIVAIESKSGICLDYQEYEKKENKDNLDFGILVKVQDHGIGISEKDIQNISNVGSSYSSRNPKLTGMPPVLRTTGKFGIGLQSIFQITDNFHAYTRTKNGEGYDISFSSGSGNADGVINTTNLENIDTFPFGTQIKFLVPGSKKPNRDRCNSPCLVRNPFVPDYEKEKKLTIAEEMLTQMIHYLNGLFGEMLFPIIVVAKNPFSKRKCIPFSENEKSSIIFREFSYDESVLTTMSEIDNEELINNISWAYRINFFTLCKHKGKLTNGDYYAFDKEKSKLFLWSKKHNTLA